MILDKIAQKRVYYWNEAVNWPWTALNVSEASIYRSFPFFSVMWLWIRGKLKCTN